jgi:hypothetical protein
MGPVNLYFYPGLFKSSGRVSASVGGWFKIGACGFTGTYKTDM